MGRLSHNSERVINLNKLTYERNQNSLRSLTNDDRYIFKQGDIDNRILVSNILAEYRPRAIINFSAESHVDRSIEVSGSFIQTNIVGTHGLLECSRQYYDNLSGVAKAKFRFYTYLRMRFMGHWVVVINLLLKKINISQIVLMQRVKRQVTIWCEPIIIRMAFPS